MRRVLVGAGGFSTLAGAIWAFPQVDKNDLLLSARQQTRPLCTSVNDSSKNKAPGCLTCVEDAVAKVPSLLAWGSSCYNANKPLEDRHGVQIRDNMAVFGVFDGHGGWQVADFVCRNIFDHIFDTIKSRTNGSDKIDDCYEKNIQTAFPCGLVMLLSENGNELVIANAGDCRAILDTASIDYNAWTAIALTTDHSANSLKIQRELALAHPGENTVRCKRPGACYIKGKLMPARGFGDLYLKLKAYNGPEYSRLYGRARGRHIPDPYTPPYVSCQPEVTSVITREKPEGSFVVMASDGLWDELSNDEAVNILSPSRICELAADRLVHVALSKAAARNGMTTDLLQLLPSGKSRRQLHDDITVMVIFLK
eukprot:GSMAST32.ASY1.ANO1.2145.1 assembled CDS